MPTPDTLQRIAAPWRPTRRRAFLGSFAPAFYDLANPVRITKPDRPHPALELVNPVRITEDSRPHPVLENAVGLMLCYDELWFLDRSLCPESMQELDFVYFVSDDAELSKRARDAHEYGYDLIQRRVEPLEHKLLRDHVGDKLEEYHEYRHAHWQAVQRRNDQHKQLAAHMTQAMCRAGHPYRLVAWNSWKNKKIFPRPPLGTAQRAEWFIADALDLGPMDCIVTTGNMLVAMDGLPASDNKPFEHAKVAAIEEILHIRSIDCLTPKGPWHDHIADLRQDKRLKDLRQFLAGKPSPDGTAQTLANEVERLIVAHSEEGFLRGHRAATLRTIGSMSLGFLGNQLLPGLGSVLGPLVNADRLVSDFQFRRESRWAAFVVDSRRSRGQAREADHTRERENE